MHCYRNNFSLMPEVGFGGKEPLSRHGAAVPLARDLDNVGDNHRMTPQL
jgi:hypothetical protein